MNMIKYLHESNKTAAGAKPDLTIFEGDQKNLLHASLEFIGGAVHGDFLKRAIFYSSARANLLERSEKVNDRLNKLAAAIEEGKARQLTDKEMELWHAAAGLASEAAEIMEEIVTAAVENREIDKINIREELGDTLWYQALGIRWLGVMNAEHGVETFESVGQYNISKLTARYPQRFTKEAALERNLEVEKVALTDKNSVAANG